MKFLATADASGDATLDFTAFDAASYDAYLFVLGNIIPSTDPDLIVLRTSTDGGSNYDSGASDYLFNRMSRDSGDSANVWTTSGGSADRIPLEVTTQIGGAAGEDGVSGWLYVFHPHLAKQTHLVACVSYIGSDGQLRIVLAQGMRNAAEDVNAIRFDMNTGNFESGTITMYGLENA